MICFATPKIHFLVSDQLQFHVRKKPKPKPKLRLEFKSKSLSVSVKKPQSVELNLLYKSKFNSMVMIETSGASGRINALLSIQALRSLLVLIQAFVLLLISPFRGGQRKGPLPLSKEDVKRDGGGSYRKVAVLRVPVVPWRSSASAAALVDQEVATRRSLAISRVMQEYDDDESVREFSLFATSRGDTIFTQSWMPVSNKVRGLVVILHGLNEHSGRYSDFAKQLNVNGYKVYGMDWIGHGGSDGLHAYVNSLDDAITDMKSFLGKVTCENPGIPCFVFGHSTGAAIVLKAALDPKVEACVTGIVLTSPAVGVQPSHPIFRVLAPIISLLIPKYQLSAANKKGMPVSRDPEALVAKYSDPLVYTGSIRVRTGYEILRISTYLQQNLNKLNVPFFVLHGTADTVTDPEGSRKLYDEASSMDKNIKLLDGFLHDLLFEPERDDIVNEIIEWFNHRM
ncbi:hypothetical protein LguiB_022524 [Lonicera macranthoides]